MKYDSKWLLKCIPRKSDPHSRTMKVRQNGIMVLVSWINDCFDHDVVDFWISDYWIFESPTTGFLNLRLLNFWISDYWIFRECLGFWINTKSLSQKAFLSFRVRYFHTDYKSSEIIWDHSPLISWWIVTKRRSIFMSIRNGFIMFIFESHRDMLQVLYTWKNFLNKKFSKDFSRSIFILLRDG